MKNLNSINTLKWPFPMIFDRLKTKFLPFFLSGNHTVVSTITKAVPLFPSLIKWLLQVPWTINWIFPRRKITMLKAFSPHTSSLLAVTNTCSVKPTNLVIRCHETDNFKTAAENKQIHEI